MFGFVGAPLLPRAPRTRTSSSRLATCSTATATGTHDLDGAQISGPLQPVGHNILVHNAKAAEKTIGGLILSSDAKEQPTYGEAVAVGPGRYFPAGGMIPMQVKEGNTVLFAKYGGTTVKYDGEKHTIVTQDDILCVLKDGKYEAGAVEPIHDRLMIRIDKAASELESGILLSSGGADKPTTGTVAAVGTGRVMENGEIEPMPVGIGDKVCSSIYPKASCFLHKGRP